MWPLLFACAQGPAAQDLLARTESCDVLPGTRPFATDTDDDDLPVGPGSVDLCGLDSAVWWRADFDVDCDGGQGDPCLEDESYLPETAAIDGDGDFLDASDVPYVVVPLPWDPLASRDQDFYYCDRGLALGGVAAVIYEDRVEYAVIADEGPVTSEPEGADGECSRSPLGGGVLGEGSYALADSLGIDPDPNTGGVDCNADCPVTWILFTDAEVEDPGDRREVVRLGHERALALVDGG